MKIKWTNNIGRREGTMVHDAMVARHKLSMEVQLVIWTERCAPPAKQNRLLSQMVDLLLVWTLFVFFPVNFESCVAVQ